MRLLLFAVLLSFGCGRSGLGPLPPEASGPGSGDAFAGDAPLGDPDPGDGAVGLQMEFWHPDAIQISTCHPIKLTFLDSARQSVAPAMPTTVRFTMSTGISLFSDGNCDTPTSEIAVGPADANYYLSFSASTTGASNLNASAPPHLPATATVQVLQPTWTEAIATVPFGRRHLADSAVWPMTDQVILYGGGPTGSAAAADMWAWDGAGWNELCDPCEPGPRIAHGMAYYGNQNQLVIFGGASEWQPVNRLGDTWLWDGSSFGQDIRPGPSAREDFGFAAAAWNMSIYLFGGRTDSGFSDELWQYDDSGWQQIAASGPWPAARRAVAAAFDVRRDAFVIYGGENGNALDDAWSWDGDGWTELCSNCTGTPRFAASMVYYPPARALLVVGGFDGTVALGGTWDFTVMAPSSMAGEPPARDSVSTVYDGARHELLSIGGNGPDCTGDCEDLWLYGGP